MIGQRYCSLKLIYQSTKRSTSRSGQETVVLNKRRENGRIWGKLSSFYKSKLNSLGLKFVSSEKCSMSIQRSKIGIVGQGLIKESTCTTCWLQMFLFHVNISIGQTNARSQITVILPFLNNSEKQKLFMQIERKFHQDSPNLGAIFF